MALSSEVFHGSLLRSHSLQQGVGSPSGTWPRTGQVCWLPSEDDTGLSWLQSTGHARKRHWSSASTRCPLAHLPCRAWSASPFPDFGQKTSNSQGLLFVSSSLSYLTLLEEFLANKAKCTRRPLFSFLLLIRSLSLAQESASSGKAGMSFWIVFICWRFGVKALPVNCILILSAVCICFPLPPSPGLIYGFPSPCFPLSQWPGRALLWGLGPQTGARPVLLRWAEKWCKNPAICVMRINLDQAFLPSGIDVPTHALCYARCYRQIEEPGSWPRLWWDGPWDSRQTMCPACVP